MSQSVLVLRTNKVDDDVRSIIQLLSGIDGLSICVAADMSNGPLIFSDVDSVVSLSSLALEDRGLVCEKDALWRCGDYALFMARERYPDATHFWLMEPDVYINAADLQEFFSLFANSGEVDFFASRYGPANSSWVWYQCLSPYHQAIHQCVFSFVRLSGRAIDYLYTRRCDYGKNRPFDSKGKPLLWANDEVFCSTELTNAGFICRDLNSINRRIYDRSSFRVTPPISLTRLESLECDSMVYHPALRGTEFSKKLWIRLSEAQNRHLKPAEYRERFNNQVLQDLMLESGAADRDLFAERLDEIMALSASS